MTNHPLLRRIGRKGRPVILSTGMSTLGEIEEAIRVICEGHPPGLALLQCTSSYPAPDPDTNLLAMRTLSTAFRLPVGFSDHTAGVVVAIAAAALGAVIIEKHLTLDKSLPGPDHALSLVPGEFASLVESIRRVEMALGDPVKRITASEIELRTTARRSICAARTIPAGVTISGDDLSYKRPGIGIPPSMAGIVIGATARREIEADAILDWTDIQCVETGRDHGPGTHPPALCASAIPGEEERP